MIFTVALLGVLPLGYFARNRPRLLTILVFALAFLPFLDLEQFSINFVSHETYRGDSRGFEITLVDLLAVSLLFAIPKATLGVPYRKVRYVYLAVALFSVTQAAVPIYSLFAVWKILRAYFLMMVVAKVCETPRFGPILLNGLAVGVVYSTVIALEQRYLFGMYRVQGDFPHSNSLGMAVNMVLPIALALLLAGHGGALAAASCVGATVCVIMTLSRGSIAMLALAVVIVLVGSLMRGITRRKVVVTLSAIALGAVLMGYAANTIIERFLEAPEVSTDARDRFEAAAAAMLRRQPLGIGLNNFSHTLSQGGYAAEVHLPEVDRDGLAHNIFWLTLAEMGYLGLVAYLLTVLVPMGVAARAAWRSKGDVRGDVALGILAALIVTAIQGSAEWVARQTTMMYFTWALCGMVATLAQQVHPKAGSAREPGGKAP